MCDFETSMGILKGNCYLITELILVIARLYIIHPKLLHLSNTKEHTAEDFVRASNPLTPVPHTGHEMLHTTIPPSPRSSHPR